MYIPEIILAQFTLERCNAAQNHEKFTKTVYFLGFKVVQDHRSCPHTPRERLSAILCLSATVFNLDKLIVLALVQMESPHPLAQSLINAIYRTVKT